MRSEPTPSLLKTFRLIPRYFYLSVLRTSEFKFNFYSYVGLYIIQMVFYVVFWQAVKPPPTGGWTVENYILLTGFVTFNISLQEVVWATGMLDQMILGGDLMVVMARPENTYFGLVLRRMGAMAFLPALMGLGLILYQFGSGVSDEGWRFFLALVLSMMGAVVMRAVLVTVSSLAFKHGRIGALKASVYNCRELSRFPLNILHPALSSVLIFILPAMMISTWPTLVARIATPGRALMVLGAGFLLMCAWIGIASWTWTRGLRNYEGTSL